MDGRMLRHERLEFNLANGLLRGALAVLLAAGSFGSAAAEIQSGTDAKAETSNLERAAASLTLGQMRAAAAEFLPTLEQVAQTIRRQLEQARASRDVVKVLCLGDKLNQVDTVVRSTRDRLESLDAAAKRNDLDRTRHEFTVVQVLRERLQMLSHEATQCVGADVGFIDDAKVIVEVDPTLPLRDPTKLPADPIYSVPPTVSSPTR